MLPIRALAALVIAAAVLAGCATSVDTNSAQPSRTLESTEPEAGSDTPEVTPEAPATEKPQAEAPQTCPIEIQTEMENSIRSQTEAFAAEDFELAYSYASPTFRANVDIQSFVAIIGSSYGPLLSSTQLAFSNCFNNQNFDLGIIEVRFVEAGADLYGLRYFLSATELGWRVEAASNLELVATGS
jgi:hypothetical protein